MARYIAPCNARTLLDGPFWLPTVTATRLLDTWNRNGSELGYASPNGLHHVLQLQAGDMRRCVRAGQGDDFRVA
jgi:hypothetical protein